MNLTWLDDRGRPRPKKPAKAKIPKEIKELRATLTTQRRRYERLMATGSTWPWSRFRTGVLGHPVVCAIAANLIVETEDGAKSFLPATDKPKLKQDERVRLWHPSGKTAKEILGWRERIEREHVTQPFKQAHREVYLLTPAEQESGSTTNRFGGHILRQHALNALCEARGWRYRLQGPFDPGPDSLPTIELPGPGLRAQLSVETIEHDDLQSAHAIFLYVRTEGLRFTRADTRASVELADIPPRVLSEVLRDVDLFISVAGVAADPTWPLKVPESWAQGWRESAFGELTLLGQRRREVLQPLLAALPAADLLSLEDRFLHVRGRRHEYRIHLGSGNVLREPGSRHVCIVAAGGVRLPGEPGHLWLPFEGDEMLALIVSKALMLARDDEIADPSIRAQLDAP